MIPDEPTSEQCESKERLADFCGVEAYACWYPQMGGYVGKAVVLISDPASEDGEADRCFEAYVWHDGEFPFKDADRNPVHIHHCMPSQFIDFGQFILDKQTKGKT